MVVTTTTKTIVETVERPVIAFSNNSNEVPDA
jgi:hypothetical protein